MRADRLISLMLLLNANGQMTARDLAEQLEVSERTIYRDIEALCMAGIPVYTQSGVNGGVFLDEHYRISLTGLSHSEVLSLFVAGDPGPLHDLGLSRAEGLLKLLAALPSSQRAEVERLRQRFHIDPSNWFQTVEEARFLPVLQEAVWQDRQVHVSYETFEGQISERTLDAYALVAKVNIWYFIGKKPSGEMRNYRLARFHTVSLLETHFYREPDFDLAAYWKAACETFEKVSWQQLEISPG
jgi:predicted DNA-binding transcriptional regulator YafY